MAACPNCANVMALKRFDSRNAGAAIEIDACESCRLLWFDQWESNNLAPRGVLGLFQYIGAATTQPVIPNRTTFSCVRCGIRLDPTRDIQRTTPFNYWRCGMGHGKLISFHQFLREKNFIRTPSPVELAKLRETIRQISCSQCGAPIDLTHDSACTHCGAPIAMVDPDSIARQVKELTDASVAASTAASPEKVRNAVIDAQLDAILEMERMRRREEREERVDLVSIGVQAIGTALAIWLDSR